MMKKEKLNEISKKLSANQDVISAFRHNLFLYVEDKDITIKEISEKSDVPFSTLNSFLYGNSKDIKLSTAVKLAKALNISIDELVGAETINEITKESMSICRNLPDNDLYLVRWFIRYLEKENSKIVQNKRFVSVMELDYTDGNLKITTSYKKVDIGNVNEIYRHKIFFGITMPCDNYMPHYSPYDILLIANDRKPTHTDNALIRIGKYIGIARIDFNNKIYSIRDNKYRCDMNEIDEVIGYICCVI